MLKPGVVTVDRVTVDMPRSLSRWSRCWPSPDRRGAHGRLWRLLDRGARQRLERRRRSPGDHLRRRLRRGAPSALKNTVDEAVDRAHEIPQRDRGQAGRPRHRWSEAATSGGTTSSSRHGPRPSPSPWTPNTPCLCFIRRDDGEAQGPGTHRGSYLPGRQHAQGDFDIEPDDDSTGGRPTWAGSTATATSSTGRCDPGATEVILQGSAEPQPRALVGGGREVRRDDPLYRADGDPAS